MTKIGSLTCFGQKPEAEGQIRKRGFLSLLCLKKPEVFKLAGLHALRIKTKPSERLPRVLFFTLVVGTDSGRQHF
jgi:hypothetical protein